MIIVYLSLALVVAAIIGFAVSMAQTGKRMAGTMARISKTGEQFRRQAEAIKAEKNQLTKNFSLIQLDYYKKKETVQKISSTVSDSVLLVQKNMNQTKKAFKGER